MTLTYVLSILLILPLFYVELTLFSLGFLGFVLERCCGQHRDDRGRACAEHSLSRQFLGVSPQETLAKRALPVHQEHHGTRPTSVLDRVLLGSINGAAK